MITLVKPAARDYSSVIVADPITGIKNGSNQVFNTTYDYKPGHISFMYNGQSLHAHEDFLESGTNELTLLHTAPFEDDILRATYELVGTIPNPASSISGRKLLYVGDESKYVSFSKTFPNTNYKLNVDLVTEGSDPSVYSFVITDKSTTGFRVYFSGEIDTADYFLEWSAM